MNAGNKERAIRLIDALRALGLAAIVCAHPKNVLMLTGYWPIIGNSMAVADREGRTTLLVPEDELEYCQNSNADETLTFKVGISLLEDIRSPLAKVLQAFRQSGMRIGYEHGPTSQETSYVAMTQYGCGMLNLLRTILPQCAFISADDLLAQ